MRVSVSCLPPLGERLNAPDALDLPDGATLAHALERLRIPPGMEVLVLLDGQAAHPAQPLAPGQSIRLLPMVDGG